MIDPRTDYWRESLADLLDSVGITATGEQIDQLAEAVVISLANEGMALGQDAISGGWADRG